MRTSAELKKMANEAKAARERAEAEARENEAKLIREIEAAEEAEREDERRRAEEEQQRREEEAAREAVEARRLEEQRRLAAEGPDAMDLDGFKEWEKGIEPATDWGTADVRLRMLNSMADSRGACYPCRAAGKTCVREA
jgi:hypothetical protein